MPERIIRPGHGVIVYSAFTGVHNCSVSKFDSLCCPHMLNCAVVIRPWKQTFQVLKTLRCLVNHPFFLAVLGLSRGVQDLVPWSGLEQRPRALAAQSLSRWTTREVSTKDLKTLNWNILRAFYAILTKLMQILHDSTDRILRILWKTGMYLTLHTQSHTRCYQRHLFGQK